MHESTSAVQSESEVYLLVGAYSSVGCALAQRLHTRGAKLMMVGRDEDKLALIADQVDSPYVIADATNFDMMTECFEATVKKYGRIDGVASMTGSAHLKPAHLTTEFEWEVVAGSNLKAAFSVVRAATYAMMQGGGSIVLVSSTVHQLGLANHEAMTAAKAGVEGLVRSAASTYAKHGVRVNCVAPGAGDRERAEQAQAIGNALHEAVSVREDERAETADQIARVIDWLLKRGCSFTGQTIGVDQGLSSVRFKHPNRWSQFQVPNHCMT
ncbi:MAG TPA: SDR family oxidoreductase [Planktothrix sp.]